MHAHIIQINDSWCNTLELSASGNGYIVKGHAMFRGTRLTGRMTFVSGRVQIFCNKSKFVLHVCHKNFMFNLKYRMSVITTFCAIHFRFML